MTGEVKYPTYVVNMQPVVDYLILVKITCEINLAEKSLLRYENLQKMTMQKVDTQTDIQVRINEIYASNI